MRLDRCPFFRRFAAGAFIFFLAKGLLWLLLPALILLWDRVF